MPPPGFQQPLLSMELITTYNTTISCVNCKMIGAFLEDHKSVAYFENVK